MANDCTLGAMPEEVLVMILKECFADVVVRRLPRATTQKNRRLNVSQGLSVLFVCKKFFRIALPQFYSAATFLDNGKLYMDTRPLKKSWVTQPAARSLIRNIYDNRPNQFRDTLPQRFDVFPLEQLRTVRLQSYLLPQGKNGPYSISADCDLVQALMDKCRAHNVYLELRLQVGNGWWMTGEHKGHLRIIADTDGNVELIAAQMASKRFFDLAKSKIDALFDCDLPTPVFNGGSRRNMRATHLARSRWEKFGAKI